MRRTITSLLGLLMLFGLTRPGPLVIAQGCSVDEKLISETVSQVADMLEEKYVIPEIGKRYSDHLLSLLSRNGFAGITDGRKLAEAIVNALEEVQKDLHLKLRFDPRGVSNMRRAEAANEEERRKERELQLRAEKARNFGALELKILPGNIGYFRLDSFPGEAGSDTLISAIGFLQYAEAIVLDLRHNGGGNPEMIMLLGSYFFDPDDGVHFSSFYHRIKDRVYQHRGFFYVPGRRLPHTKLYLLVSQRTFSAAEGFAYDLQCLKRATIVGEKTMGAAHAANPFVVNDCFLLQLPFARPISPVTNSNWEGSGVEPDIPCQSDAAIAAVYKIELDRMLTILSGENDINALGYQFLAENMADVAIEVFTRNVRLHPESANVYDSLGEAYAIRGDKSLAIQNYRKSLELDPQNANADEMLKKLEIK